MTKELALTADPRDFFREEIQSVLHKQKLHLEDDIEFYVVNLLSNFVFSAPDLFDTPLALRLKNVLEAPEDLKASLYKDMGDSSLYMAGFFQESFNRKTYDVDYFISLGSMAYKNLSDEIKRRPSSELQSFRTFERLSVLFSELVETLSRLSKRLKFAPKTNVLATYERFDKLKNSHLLELLEKEGIIPIPGTMKIAQ